EDVAACGDVQRLQSVAPLPSDPAAAARAAELKRHLAEADARRIAGKLAEAAELAAASVAEARQVGHPGLLAEALFLQGRTEEDRGQAKAAEEALLEAARAAIAARDDVRLVGSWSLLAAVVGFREARPAEGRRWNEYAQAVLARLSSPALPQADVERATAMISYSEGKYGDSLAAYQRALALKRGALGPDALEVAQMENNVAVLLGQLDRNAEAREHHQHALAAFRRALGPDHPVVASSLDNLGIVLTNLGDLQEAEKVQREALAIRERVYSAMSPDVAKSLNNLGRLLDFRGRYAEARGVLERALKVTQATEGPNHPMSAWVLNNLGTASLGQHEPKRALEEYTRGYEVLTHRPDPHPDAASLMIGMAAAQLALQRPGDVLATLDRAEQARPAENAPTEDLAQAKFLRARALRALHRDPARQQALAEEAGTLYQKAGATYREQQAEVRAFLDSGRARP
ncbi:MAG TPA: tetratricopeptide repeat protein, partial [Myxococcales bacterium]|nr:tetratricopeptide repeat protein [Myxococcales bacterium]